MPRLRTRSINRVASAFMYVLTVITVAHGQQQMPSLRAPAIPLVTHDPYFSVWSKGNKLTDDSTRHWTDVPQELNGIVRVDDHAYRFLGNADRGVAPLDAKGFHRA